MNQPAELSLEQQFSIRSFETQVSLMSEAQAKDFLVQMYEQMVMRENAYKELLNHDWFKSLDGMSEWDAGLKILPEANDELD